MERCLHCRKEFKSERGLHSHLRTHGGQSKYYQTFFPRFDLFDKSVIEFKNKSQYFSQFFNSDENRKAFYNSPSQSKLKKETLIKEIKNNADYKGFSFLPSDSYLTLSDLPTISTIRNLFGSCYSFCKEAGLDLLFSKKLPDTFLDERLDMTRMQIFIDSREQQPFEFKNSLVNKLDFGDYTASGDFYSKVFVERKGLGDFASSMSSGYERFKKELDRAKEFNSYIVMVVEGGPLELKQHVESLRKGKAPNLSFSMHNARKLLIDYANSFQIVFCKNKEQASDITQRILFFGKESIECDLQYFLSNVD